MTQLNPDSIYVDHLITQIHSNLTLLANQGKINQSDLSVIKSKLPPISSLDVPSNNSRESIFPVPSTAGPIEHSSPRTDTTASQPHYSTNVPQPHHSPNVPQPHHSTNVPQPHHSANVPQPHHSTNVPQPHHSTNVTQTSERATTDRYKRARALWSYNGSAADDLSFTKGDIIVVLAEENADWWRGEVVGNQAGPGLFPSNHVEVIPNGPESSTPARAPLPPATGYTGPTNTDQYNQQSHVQYGTPPPPQHNPSTQYVPPPSNPNQYPNGPPIQYGPSQGSNQWQAPPYNNPYNQPDYKSTPLPPPLVHTQSAPPAQVIVEKPKKKPFQGRFGQALAGGAGFGAGSAVATHVVNAIL
ncbi:hypothetical protein CROQUDRAFT_659999 [Cronartium quercuum f. sp. fusiforme G11]|uniref:SH3 domain-containing protein n=1 Tax=Cronartium quercuum f. sp. fusiforme G11 TaxID=708437 RepID=A0A9P6TAB2_9BASI|nr:hypothetical protein CROQUDRAFT_659999 [Cronartium quercuum f. sp. fusiforme G11]